VTHTTIANTDPRNEFSWPRAALEGIITFLAQTSQAMDCARDAERLSRLSDGELYRLGVRRPEVIQHAFRGFLGH
jgi:hypothetical protein